MAITQVSSVSTYINTIYERAIFAARELNLMANLVHNWSAKGWMNRVIPQWAQITAESVGETDDYSNETEFSKSAAATFTPGEIIAQSVLTLRMLETNPEDARRDCSLELGGAIATKIDVDILGDFSSLAADLGPGAGSAADLQSFADCVAYIRAQKVRGLLNIVLHPYHWHDIWAELGQPAATKVLLGEVANRALRDYFVGDWIGCTWYSSANITVDASDDAVSGVFHMDALGLDVRRRPQLDAEYDASARAYELNMHAGYAHGTYRSGFGVYYTADASAPS